ncbi:NAD(P)H-dependent oxidoreductase [Streptomyces macrosporus]|uniref:NAD(P)H-dependent oxidoreductase n=1 Tax=Streptomyces macrosporus TaxID=44032 RepID=A0ABN3JG20_9ACTN
MTDTPLRLAVIIGSVREGRFGPTVANWFVTQAEKFGRFDVDVIDLADWPLPVVMPGWDTEPDAETARIREELSRRVARADAYAVVTPEYNHSFPASLKNTIDWFREEWFAKPVGLISYGGQGGGLRAAEHLRQVFAEVHAMTVRNSLSFHNAWDVFGPDGQPRDEEAAASAAKDMLSQMDWWGTVLREGRRQRPYTA